MLCLGEEPDGFVVSIFDNFRVEATSMEAFVEAFVRGCKVNRSGLKVRIIRLYLSLIISSPFLLCLASTIHSLNPNPLLSSLKHK